VTLTKHVFSQQSQTFLLQLLQILPSLIPSRETPPALLRVMDHDSAQISSGTSGLFTPAQRSEGGTPRQFEDDAAESLTTPHDVAEKGLESASIPLRIKGDPGVDAVERADERSYPSRRGSAELTVSQSLEEDSPFRRVVSEHSSVPNPSSEYVPGSPSIAEGDNDADGEVDPDYSPTHGTKKLHQEPAHQLVGEGREIASRKIRIDVLGPNVIASDLESPTTR